MKNKIEWRNFGNLTTAEEILTYLDGREYGHTNYYHYTKLDIINSILENKELWISSVSGFNDTIDQAQFSDSKPQKYYAICFSTGVNENLPLWYLYSGVNGRGGRLRLAKSKIKELIEKGTYSLCKCVDKKAVFVKKLSEKDMTISFKDVVYSRIKDDGISLKYNTMTNYCLEKSEYEELQKSWNFFIKGLIWYYEKETRLIVTLNDDVLNELESDKNYVITLSYAGLKDFYKHISIDFAPAISLDEEQKIISDDNFAGLKQHIIATSKVKLSEYVGTVNMKICNRCQYHPENKSK